MEERKFVCKYCNKRYPCGKSLGGHIRTHMNENSTQENADRKSNAAVIKFDAGKKRKRDLDSEAASAAAGNSVYGLRENPKKSMRFVHSGNNTSNAERFCKECGKGFSSLKALCGHMACHSEKEKGMSTRFESNSGFSENKQKLEMDSQSDTETSAPNQYPRRSKRTRFKNVNNQNSSANLVNGSSSVSEVEQEQEEVARCLMLLSKDFSHKGHFSLVTESSDTNSVVLEAKSPSVDMKFAVNNGKKSVSDGYEILGKKVSIDMKLKSAEIDTGDSHNSDSGYFRYGPKKADSDFSVDGVLKNDNFTGPKVEDKSGFTHYDAKLKKNMLKDCRFRNNAVDFDNTGRTSRKYESLRYNSIGVPCKKTANNFPNEEIYETGDKEWKYECVSSEKANGSYDSAYESEEDSTDTESYPAPKNHGCKALNQKKNCSKGAKKNLKAKKSKWHECPICYKIFKSGQALGGHKRSHFVGSSEENTTLVIRQSSPPPHPPPAAAAAVVVPNCLIDLNLPAPMDE